MTRPAQDYAFSLGLLPVQAWIAEATRSRDLRIGSAFLSHLIARLVSHLQDRQAEIVLPREPEEGHFRRLARASYAGLLDEPYGIPNRVSGTLPGVTETDLSRTLAELQDLVTTVWEALRRDHLARDQLGSEIWAELGEHVEAYLERTRDGSDCPFSLVWTALPVDEDEPPQAALERVDLAYAEVKRSRPVRPWLHGGPVPKCNQCARREAVGPQDDPRRWRRFHRTLSALDRVARGVRFDPGERLCHVCLARRLAGYARRRGELEAFPSTGETATAVWRARIRAAGLGDALDAIERSASGTADLGRALLDAEVRLRRLGAEEVLPLRRALEGAIASHDEGVEEPTERIGTRPPRYLALLAFDGDDVGRRIRREPEAIGERLWRFARQVEETLASYRATAFYLGGDEGLVMAPAVAALPLAFALRETYGTLFADREEAFTLSAGVVFFDYSRPLSRALEQARRTLEGAKAHRPSKNALGVAVETASGSRWDAVEGWELGWPLVRRAAGLATTGELARGWAYDVEALLASIPEREWSRSGVAAAALDEARRLFHRRLDASSVAPARRHAHREARWQALVDGYQDRWQRARPAPALLHLVGFLGREAREAGAEAGP